MKIELKDKAIEMRLNGYSFREISKALNLAKSTVGLWVGAEVLNNKAQERIRMLGVKGREKANKTNREKKIKKISEIDISCEVLKHKKYNKEDYKLFLALLYWGEGTKTGGRFSFINSDQEMIKVYLFLLRSAFVINEDKFRIRIHLHNYHNQEEMIAFWSGVTGVSKNQFAIYNKPNTGINKRPGYKGCLSIYYGDSRILNEVFIIIDRMKNLPNIAGLV